MKRRFEFVLRYWWCLALAALGALTLCTAPREARMDEAENRMLSGAPRLSLDSVLDASFMNGVESWLSDSIVGRSALIEASRRTEALFSAEKEEGFDAQRTIEALQAETLNTPPEEQTEQPDLPEQTAAQPDAPDPAEPADELPSSTAAPAALDLEVKTFWVRSNDGSVRDFYWFPVENVQNAANVLNRYRALLPPDGHVVFSEVPIATTGNSYLDHREEYEAWGCDMEAQLQTLVDDGVEIINATEVLLPHLENNEYMYYRADHHWTSRGSHVVYTAMMERLGIPPLGFEEYDYFVLNNAFGTKGLGKNDVLEVMYPLAPTESYIVTYLDKLRQIEYMRYDYTGYLAFIDGTRGPWRLFRSGMQTGRTALVIGDSFSNALLPYLLSHYDSIVMTDLRPGYYEAAKAGGTVADYIDRYGVDDVYIMLCFATSINSAYFLNGMLTRTLGD